MPHLELSLQASNCLEPALVPSCNSYMWVPCTTIMDLSSTHCHNFTKEVPCSTFNLSTKSRKTQKQCQLFQLLKRTPSSYMGFFESYQNCRVPQHKIAHTIINGLTNMINNEKNRANHFIHHLVNLRCPTSNGVSF